jgi:hypothetical protein
MNSVLTVSLGGSGYRVRIYGYVATFLSPNIYWIAQSQMAENAFLSPLNKMAGVETLPGQYAVRQ